MRAIATARRPSTVLRRRLAVRSLLPRSLRPLRPLQRPADDVILEIVVLHVCARDEAPAFSDHALYETEAWGSEFLARNCPHGRLELRVGSAEDLILEVADTAAADLIVLGWGQLLTPGQCRVVRRVLEGAGIPVLLLSARRASTLARRPMTSSALSTA